MPLHLPPLPLLRPPAPPPCSVHRCTDRSFGSGHAGSSLREKLRGGVLCTVAFVLTPELIVEGAAGTKSGEIGSCATMSRMMLKMARAMRLTNSWRAHP